LTRRAKIAVARPVAAVPTAEAFERALRKIAADGAQARRVGR